MPVTTARQKVLAYLKKNQSVSATQIGRALKMSAANVRHHLSVLASDGRIQEIGVVQKEGRGRPTKLYRLSENLLGNNLALLSDRLLAEWLGNLSSSKREEALSALAKGLVNEIGQAESKIPVVKRLALVIEKFNEMNYQARWEAGAEGPNILFGHCPYAAIIEEHPELCRMDATLVGELMDTKARQLAKIGPELGGPANCTFRLLNVSR